MKKIIMLAMLLCSFADVFTVNPVTPITLVNPKVVATPVVPAVPKIVQTPKAVVAVSPVVAKAVPPVVPKVVAPVTPVAVVPVAPKAVAVAPVAKVAVATVVPAPKTEVILSKPMASQIVGIITLKNTSKYSALWTGWKTKYKTQEGVVKYKLHTLKTPHQLQPVIKNKIAQTLQDYTVHNLPANSFVEGVSHLMINGASVSVEYKDQAWMPGTTDAIYITTLNGTSWTLDTRAMDKNYKKINSGIKTSQKNTESDPSAIEPVNHVTKAASVPVMLQDKKNQKKFKNIAESNKFSKSSHAFDHAIKAKN